VRFAAEPDRSLRQFERDAAVACGAMAVIALAVGRGSPNGAAGVLAGGALTALSYWGLKGAVDLVVGVAGRMGTRPVPDEAGQPVGVGRAAETPPAGESAGVPVEPGETAPAGSASDPAIPAGSRIGLAVKFFTRYALLAVGAYVMLTCFRVHPVGLLAGATTPFVAALVQAVRSFRAPSRGDRQ
jgi:hypothetical protein